MLDIIVPETPDQFEATKQLCWEYRTFLLTLDDQNRKVVLTFYPEDRYARLMEDLQTEHAPPGGGLRLALKDGVPVGCGMFHTVAPGTAEIKRVFVNEAACATGTGRAIMETLIGDCRAAGFERIMMDTGKVLATAIGLYLSMGFRLRGPYQDVPEIAKDMLVYFEMEL